MTLNLRVPEVADLKPRITVFGVGGAGGNAVNNMIEQELDGVEFVVANTDAQALQHNQAPTKLQLGSKVTEGLGAGAKPTVGADAAEESIEAIVDALVGSHMCFITAGMGGGTGTGAAPIIAQAARELGVLTVGVVTKPFQFEGSKRMRQAEEGLEALQKVVDTLIIIPNQNLFRVANEKTTFTQAFALADDVLYQGVKGVTDLMVRPGEINLDFADIKAVMDEMGKAMMGTGEASGEDRARQAAEKAINNPLLDEISLEGARGVLINITGGHDLTLFEVDEAANHIREKVDPNANIIVGSTLDEKMESVMRVSVVATGIDALGSMERIEPPRPATAAPLRLDPVPEPAPAPVAEEPVEEETFDAFDTDFFNASDEEDAVKDDLPPPAYQPEPEEAAPMRLEVEEEEFVAPQPRRIGEASPDTLSRLQRAATRSSSAERAEAALRLQPEQETEEVQPAPAEPERKGLGLNKLINRMTGGDDDDALTRRQPTLSAGDDSETAEKEPSSEPDIEIPAFLRRQAN
ncbi:MAG: cell division protein FtsZ [Pseudomonadota bacterium]